MAIVNGTPGNDFLDDGTSGNDTYNGGLGNDSILGTAGFDLINAGLTTSAAYWRTGNFNDFDRLSYADLFSNVNVGEFDVRIVVDLALGTVIKRDINGALGTDTVVGVDGVYGTGGNDAFAGRNFWDYEEFQGYQGNDTINGRGGDDGANYNDAELNVAGITVNLAAGTVVGDASVGTDRLREVEVIIGTGFADTYNATGYGGSSVNRNSYGENYNNFTPLAGSDTIVGNGETTINYAGAGGSLVVDLSLQTGAGVSARIITNALTGNFTLGGHNPGNDLASGVIGIRGSNYNDTLLGGSELNALVTGATISGDQSFEQFRGNGGNDFIDGRSGFDRVDYNTGNQAQGISVQLAAGTVTGDTAAIGADTLRGIEAVNSSFLDDVYNAVGFTLSNAASASANSGDVIATVADGEALASLAFNEFRALAGDDTVIGNGATRVSFARILVETLSGPEPSVVVNFSGASAGSALYGQTDGGFGSVTFSGVFAIRGGVGNDSVTGSTAYQAFEGYYGNDTLSGGLGNDLLYGHERGTLASELNLSSVFTDNDSLLGGGGNDALYGHFGNDTLNGGTGRDTMEGGTGNDVYYVDAATDVTTEAVGGVNGGVDTVFSSVTRTLGANLEHLTLTGAAAINGTGNTLANRITGNAGANLLNGGTGNDTMIGGGGNDIYVVNAAGDVVTEAASAGTDTVQSAITYTLGAHVEQLTLTGAGATRGTGNTQANLITGNGAANTLSGVGGNDTLRGGAGNDTLIGGTGNDSLTGGSGADSYRFASALNTTTNVDRMTDFNSVDDRIDLAATVFTQAGAVGQLSAAAYRAGAAAADASDRIIYNAATGQLLYDADGNGAGAAVLFATVAAGTTIGVSDFFIV